MIQRPSLSILLLAAAAFIIAQAGIAAAQNSPRLPIQIEVISITASNSPGGMDPQLKKMPFSRILPPMLAYLSYHMDSRQKQRTVCGRMLSFNLPGGIILHVAPVKIDGQRIDLIIDMFDADRPRMVNMHALLENRATLILGGPHYAPGMMIVMLNVGIVGALPPAIPAIRPPQQRPPETSASPNGSKFPQAQPVSPPDLGGVAPIAAPQE